MLIQWRRYPHHVLPRLDVRLPQQRYLTQYPIWTQTEPNLANSVFSGFPANAISSSGLVGYAAAGKSGIYKTTDGGSTWHYIDQTAGGFNWSLLALSPDGTKLILPNDTSVIYTN